MGYHAAISPLLATAIGVPPNDTPHITCDICGTARLEVVTRRGGPAAWFLNQRNPPGTGWVLAWPEDGTIIAHCRGCKPQPAGAPRQDRVYKRLLKGLCR